MVYDLEKYREKREKVLGVRKCGLSFGVIAAIVSVSIIMGLGFVVAPRAVSYVVTRNLDDAIYKLENAKSWPDEVLSQITGMHGVENAVTDKNGKRLVVTFDKTITDTGRFSTLFKKGGVKVTLLNRVSHRQRMATLKEEEEFEAL